MYAALTGIDHWAYFQGTDTLFAILGGQLEDLEHDRGDLANLTPSAAKQDGEQKTYTVSGTGQAQPDLVV